MTDRVPEASYALVRERARQLVAEGRSRVLTLRARPVWRHGDLEIGGVAVQVRPAVSQLAALDALLRREDGYLVLLTDRSEADLGDVVLVQSDRQRIETIDEWEAVPPLFGANALDPALRALGGWVPTALLDHQPPEGWPSASSGTVTADHALGALLARLLGSTVPLPDLGALLVALDDPEARARWQRVPEALRASLATWATGVHALDRPAAMAMAAAARGPVSTRALGLALDVLWPHDATLEPAQAAARARVESRVDGAAIAPLAARAFADAARAEVLRAVEVGDPTVASVLPQAEALLGDLGWSEGVARSTVLPGGLTARVRALATLLAEPDLNRLVASLPRIEGALTDVLGHERAGVEEQTILAARMAVRLVRWLATQPEHEAPAHLGASLADYLADGAWLDRAAAVLWDGAEDDAVAAAYRSLLSLVAPLRSFRDRVAADQLAEATARDEAPAGAVLVERVLGDLVWPTEARVLVLLLDGMSVPVAWELADDLVGLGWSELVPDAGARVPVLAALPTVTTVSRTAFFTGELVQGGQAAEVAAMRERFGAPLFHKDGLRASAGEALPGAVRDAIAGDARMVGVVLNTIDDALDKHDPGGTRWCVEDVQNLRALLNAAALAKRVVVLVSDHGHVVERGSRALAVQGADARWRPAGGAVGPDEVAVAGRRVVTGSAVLLVSEDARYASLRSGYHGGASLAEITIPLLMVAWPGTPEPAGWRAAPPQAPAWWHETQHAPQAGGRRARRAGASGMDLALPGAAGPEVVAAPRAADARATASGQGTLAFDVPPARTAAGPAARADLATQLVGSPLLPEQLARAGRAAPSVDEIEAVVRVLSGGGGRAHRDTLARVLGVPAASFPLATLGRVLNVEGYRVIWLDQDQVTIRLDEELLRDQFDLGSGCG